MLVRIFLFLVVLISLTNRQSVSAEKTGKQVTTLATEIEGKILMKDKTQVKVQAEGCRIAIAFVNKNVTFHLPLAGTKVTADDETLLVVNSEMTRTFVNREREPFSRLVLRFGTDAVNQVKSAFDQAILACGG